MSNPTQVLLTDAEEPSLAKVLTIGATYHPITAAYIAIAVGHALKDPQFVILYGTYAVEQLHEACES